MALRCVLFLLLLVSFTFAADQTASPSKPEAKPDSTGQSPVLTTPDDTNPPAQPAPPSSHSRIHFGGLTIGAGYSHFSGSYPYGYGPEYWAYSPYGVYGPVLWSPLYHPGYYQGFAYQPSMGNVKIQAPDKNSLVFLDGALAGRLDKLKEMWLEPGTYQLELRSSSQRFTQKIYVLSGKTLKVTSDMMISEAIR